MKSLPWSYTHLTTFVNCPRQFYRKYVVKDLPWEEKGEEAGYGIRVHKAFESYICVRGYQLDADLEPHREFLDKKIMGVGGIVFGEMKVALDRTGKLVNDYFDRDVWHRQVIDATVALQLEGTVKIFDYKTGKKKPDVNQLALNGIAAFLLFPWAELVDARYYWTSDHTETRYVWKRSDVPALWAPMVDDLKRLGQAYKNETFPPKPSGLCRGWCPVTDCEFWRPKDPKR